MTNPKITIVTICYNSEEFIADTIKSVLSQTYSNIEYFIIDGKSTDNTLKIAVTYKTDSRLKIISEKDKGIYDAMNKGISLASGDFIIFMNSGDKFYSSTIINDIFSAGYPCDSKIIYGDVEMVYQNYKKKYKSLPIKKLTYRMVFSHQSVFVSTDLLRKYGFNLNYKIGADYDFFYRIYFNEPRYIFYNVGKIVSICNATDSLTQRRQFALWKEYIDIRKSHKDFRWYIDFFKCQIKLLLNYGRERD